MTEFDAVWRASVRYRHASRELELLLRDVYSAYGDEPALLVALERVLRFLVSSAGRTDANCSVTDHFIATTEDRWRGVVSDALSAILDDMGGTLHDAVHAPNIAKTFEATPEQLLERIRELS
jgi:hypothetical protein